MWELGQLGTGAEVPGLRESESRPTPSPERGACRCQLGALGPGKSEHSRPRASRKILVSNHCLGPHWQSGAVQTATAVIVLGISRSSCVPRDPDLEHTLPAAEGELMCSAAPRGEQTEASL